MMATFVDEMAKEIKVNETKSNHITLNNKLLQIKDAKYFGIYVYLLKTHNSLEKNTYGKKETLWFKTQEKILAHQTITTTNRKQILTLQSHTKSNVKLRNPNVGYV